MLVRQVKCRQCGAPLDVLPETLLLMCEYCGSFIGLDTERIFSPDAIVEAHRKVLSALVSPSRLQARSMQLAVAMERAKEEGDRRAYAALAQESAAIFMAINPDRAPRDPEALTRQVKQMAKTMELVAFDDEIARLKAVVDSATGALTRLSRESTIEAVRRLLVANEAFYQALFVHPDYPAEGQEDPGRLAAEATRLAVESVAGILPPGTVEHVLETLFDAQSQKGEQVSCSNCGAAVDVGELERTGRCPYCGGLIRVWTESFWLTRLKGTWEVTRQSTKREHHAMAALQILLGTGEAPSADDMVAFLQWSVPYVSRSELGDSVRLLMQTYGDSDPELVRTLRALESRLVDWTPTAHEPPHPTPSAASSVPDTPPPSPTGDLSEDPWVIQTGILWTKSKPTILPDKLEASLVSMALNPFYLGATTTVAQALEFFRQAEPNYSRKRMMEYVELLLSARQDEGPLSAFLEELLSALGGLE